MKVDNEALKLLTFCIQKLKSCIERHLSLRSESNIRDLKTSNITNILQ